MTSHYTINHSPFSPPNSQYFPTWSLSTLIYIPHLATISKNSISLEFGLLHSLQIDIIYFSFLMLAGSTKSRSISGEKTKQNSTGQGQIYNEDNREFPSKMTATKLVSTFCCVVYYFCVTRSHWRQVSITTHLCEVGMNFDMWKSVSPTKSESDYELLIGTTFPVSFSLQFNLFH
jgi:hypothetical protein